MKALPWFRMYHEAIDDEKLRLLACEDRWHFIAILCCKAKGILDDGGPLLRRKVAVRLGLSTSELEEVARRLAEVELIDFETLQPLAWDERQMHSDKDETNSQRQARYRQAHKRVVTDSNALRNAPVTRIDLDLDLDKDKDKYIVSKSETPKPETPLSRLLSLSVSKKVAQDYLAIRKLKKSPLTETALAGLVRQVGKSQFSLNAALTICCERGWAGFNPEWLTDSDSPVAAVPKVHWYETDDASHAKARELGIEIEPDMRELRIKINAAIQAGIQTQRYTS